MSAQEIQYTAVNCLHVRHTDKAILIEDVMGEEHWVPRTLIHGADDLEVGGMLEAQDIDLRIVDWKVRELDLG